MAELPDRNREYALTLRYETDGEHGAWVVICPDPDIVCQGSTWRQAIDRLEQTIIQEPIIRAHLAKGPDNAVG